MAQDEGACYHLTRNGITRQAELHWYEAHGIGRKEFKIKKLLPTL